MIFDCAYQLSLVYSMLNIQYTSANDVAAVALLVPAPITFATIAAPRPSCSVFALLFMIVAVCHVMRCVRGLCRLSRWHVWNPWNSVAAIGITSSRPLLRPFHYCIACVPPWNVEGATILQRRKGQREGADSVLLFLFRPLHSFILTTCAVCQC
jgi:hypothetical protein